MRREGEGRLGLCCSAKLACPLGVVERAASPPSASWGPSFGSPLRAGSPANRRVQGRRREGPAQEGGTHLRGESPEPPPACGWVLRLPWAPGPAAPPPPRPRPRAAPPAPQVPAAATGLRRTRASAAGKEGGSSGGPQLPTSRGARRQFPWPPPLRLWTRTSEAPFSPPFLSADLGAQMP